MARPEYKHFEQEFRTKFKIFSFSLVERGSVRITECRKTSSFSISLDLGGVAWISGVLNSVLRKEPIEEFQQFYRAHNYRVIIESSRNSAGRYIKICKIQNGFLSQLFIPVEANSQGWRNFSSSINSFFNTKNEQKEVRTGVLERKQVQPDSKAEEKELKHEVWRMSRKLEAPVTNKQVWTRKEMH